MIKVQCKRERNVTFESPLSFFLREKFELDSHDSRNPTFTHWVHYCCIVPLWDFLSFFVQSKDSGYTNYRCRTNFLTTPGEAVTVSTHGKKFFLKIRVKNWMKQIFVCTSVSEKTSLSWPSVVAKPGLAFSGFSLGRLLGPFPGTLLVFGWLMFMKLQAHFISFRC